MALDKVIKYNSRRDSCLHRKVSPRPQNQPEFIQKLFKVISKISHYALSGEPTAVTSPTNHSISLNDPKVKLFGLRRGFLHHKVPHQTTKNPELAQKTSKFIQKVSCSALSGDPANVTLATNHSDFSNAPK